VKAKLSVKNAAGIPENITANAIEKKGSNITSRTDHQMDTLHWDKAVQQLTIPGRCIVQGNSLNNCRD
jgi:hypothetical protein